MFVESVREIRAELDEIRADGLYKTERVIASPAGPTSPSPAATRYSTSARTTTSGLADDPRVIAAAKARWTAGATAWPACGSSAAPRTCTASSRSASRAFLGTEDTILYSLLLRRQRRPLRGAARRATTRSSPTSSTTRRSSTASGCARRAGYRYAQPRHGRPRGAARGRRRRPAAGSSPPTACSPWTATSPRSTRSASWPSSYDAMVMVDDSHAVGFVGPHGPRHARAAGVHGPSRHRHRHAGQGARRRVRRLHRAARREIVELLRQRSRPYLFSNSVAPADGRRARWPCWTCWRRSDELRDRLRENTALFRRRMAEAGFDILPGEHPIVPVMFGDAALAAGWPTCCCARASTSSASATRSSRGQGPHPGPAVRGAHPGRTSSWRLRPSPLPGTNWTHCSRRMPALPRRADRRGDHLIVCGDGPLAYRVTEELTSRYGERVTVILPSRQRHHGPRLAALPGSACSSTPSSAPRPSPTPTSPRRERWPSSGRTTWATCTRACARRSWTPGSAWSSRSSTAAWASTSAAALPRLHGPVRHRDVRAVLRRRRARRDRARATSGSSGARSTSPSRVT